MSDPEHVEALPATMRAVVYDAYGPPSNLRVEQVPVPRPAAGEVLVQLVATSVNLSDWETLRGDPFYARIGGLTRPVRRILGSDIAGMVVAIGRGVSRFAVGDEVYGDILERKGGFAEYAVAPESALARKPAQLSFAQAAAIPQPGEIAVEAMTKARPGSRLLVNGAGGGSGAFLLQLAKAAGMHVTGVDNAGKLDFMRLMGADETIDYREQDFTRTGPYDLVIDLVAYRSVFAYRRALAPGGRCFVVGGTTRVLIRMLTVGALVGLVSGTRLGALAVPTGPARFEPLAARCAAGEIQVPIDAEYNLVHTREALEHHGNGRALGKVVVRIRDDP
ncbi:MULTISPECIES: NAD(P)-dependent alcohol dehydrogenase [Microbacterium]|uniref:NAD(P)-dependent alcohol dehydrogenase n=1 Tax=Microbacterium TaxID=33882 RepID=UPI0025F869E1|nr:MULTISPECIES: NAD(P)-dependent alcohol dehydrogenase [unclassified Microbacterium]